MVLVKVIAPNDTLCSEGLGFRHSLALLRGPIVAIAVLTSLSVTGSGLAQDATPEVHEGLVGSESTSYTRTDDGRSLLSPMAFEFMVFEFEDEELAGTVFGLVVEESSSDLSDVEIMVTGQDEVEGLDDVGNERYVIEAVIEDSVSS